MEQTVNERFELLIKTLGLSQIEVSKRLSVTHGTVNRWLNGHVEIRKSNAKTISNEFNVNFDWFMEGRGEMFNEGGIKLERKVNGWKDEAFVKMEQYNESLKKEVDFLKEIIATLLPPSNSKQSFQIASVGTGRILEFCDTSVRVAG